MEPAKSKSYDDIILSVVIPDFNEAVTIEESLNRDNPFS